MLALRTQINPHLLFNAMNSISSLMYTDVRAADGMLEQLSCLLRISLERGTKQLISLREEMEFVEMYLSLQDRRSAGQVRQDINIDPRLYDALVPTMLLQPLVENAYVHGISRVNAGGLIQIMAKEESGLLSISVRNSGVGLKPAKGHPGCMGMGLNNIKKRLRLHFGEDCLLHIHEIADSLVEVIIKFPLTFASPHEIASQEIVS
jgi:LytS/YehU family sensor histidine kinase